MEKTCSTHHIEHDHESRLNRSLLLFFNHAAPHAFHQLDITRTITSRLVEERDKRIRTEKKRFKDIHDVKLVIAAAGKMTPVQARSYFKGRIAERIVAELELKEQPLLLNFFENPAGAISKSHAEV